MASVSLERPDPSAARESVLDRLARLLRLQLELGFAETRKLIVTALVAGAIALVAAVALVAALVVLVAGALALLFDARWEPLVIGGGGVAMLAAAGLGWSVWRMRRLSWPRETLDSFAETWRWLVAQTRSRLTLR
jgi:hypothetical protein